MNLTLGNSSSTQPASMEWDIGYSTTDVASVSVAAGPAASGSSKSVSCNNTPGMTTCVLWGQNRNTVSTGVVASVSLKLASSTTNTASQIQVRNGAASAGDGSHLALATTGNTVTIQQPPTLNGFSCTPNTVTLLTISTCKIALTAGAPSGGASITLSASIGGLSIPATITIPAGSSSASFVFTPIAVILPTQITLTAAYRSVKQSFGITMNPSSSTPVFGSGAGSDTDIGNPARAGGSSLSGSTYTLNGAGADIWYASDQLNFNYWPISNDGVFTARVLSLTNTAMYAKAGVMIRQSLSSNSAYAFAEASPSLFSFHYRTFTSNYSSQGPYFNVTFPLWLRVIRSNGNFTAYSSSDGKNWTQINQTVSVAMTGTVYAGLAVTSQNPGATATAVFDNLSFTPSSSSAPDFTLNPSSVAPAAITAGQSTSFNVSTGAVNGFGGSVALSTSGLPAGATAVFSPATVSGAATAKLSVTTSKGTPTGAYPFTVTGTGGGVARTTSVTLIVQNSTVGAGTDADIGNPAIAGSASTNSGVFTVKGSGKDIWETSDQFNFNWWQVTGDVTITARVASVPNTNTYAKAGVMIRETLSPNSKFAFAVGTPTMFNFHYRTGTGSAAASGGYFPANYPLWLRLVRSKGTFTAYSSADGAHWTQINSPMPINMASSVYIGLAVTSHDTTKLNTVLFDNVTYTQP